MARSARTYLVTNPSARFTPGRRLIFRSSAPVGTVVVRKFDGRPVRVLLTGNPLNGGLLAAELQITYL